MAVIALPDGREVEFPDDMPETQVQTVLLRMTQGAKAAAKPSSGVRGVVGTAANGLLEGIPILGPLISGGVDRAAAFGNSVGKGTSYGDELKTIQDRVQGYKDEHPYIDTGSQIAGAVGGTVPLMVAAPVAMGVRGASLGGRALMGATSGSAIGGADAAVRSGGDAKSTVKGAIFGAAAGGAAPYIGKAVGYAARTVAAPIAARLLPDNAAKTAIIRVMQRSGKTPAEIQQALTDATADGQGVFTAADAIGHPGQRMLSSIARTPGDGREAVVNALETRQAGQGRRVSGALADAFDAPDTATQRASTLQQQRSTVANANYGSARDAAHGVDVSPALAAIDDVVRPGVNPLVSPGAGIAEDSVERTLSRARTLLTDGRSNLSDFTAILRVKQDIDDVIGKAVRAGENNKARLLGNVRDRLDNSLASASEPYAAARDAYRQGSREIDAVDTGRAAATRGRSEDTIRAFSAMSPGEQSAFRSGYVDPLIEQAQGGAIGVNKARPLLNDATAQEFPAFAAPGRADQLTRRLDREQTMFGTRNAALGGSRTADNLADQAELGSIDPTIIGNLISGNWIGALKQGGVQALRQLQGMPAPVRQRIATQLLQTDAGAAGRDLAQAIARGDQLTDRQMMAAQAILRGGAQQSN